MRIIRYTHHIMLDSRRKCRWWSRVGAVGRLHGSDEDIRPGPLGRRAGGLDRSPDRVRELLLEHEQVERETGRAGDGFEDKPRPDGGRRGCAVRAAAPRGPGGRARRDDATTARDAARARPRLAPLPRSARPEADGCCRAGRDARAAAVCAQPVLPRLSSSISRDDTGSSMSSAQCTKLRNSS